MLWNVKWYSWQWEQYEYSTARGMAVLHAQDIMHVNLPYCLQLTVYSMCVQKYTQKWCNISIRVHENLQEFDPALTIVHWLLTLISHWYCLQQTNSNLSVQFYSHLSSLNGTAWPWHGLNECSHFFSYHCFWWQTMPFKIKVSDEKGNKWTVCKSNNFKLQSLWWNHLLTLLQMPRLHNLLFSQYWFHPVL